MFSGMLFRIKTNTTVMTWILALRCLTIITIVNCEANITTCDQLDDATDYIYPAKCSKAWFDKINKTIINALKHNPNFEHDIKKLYGPLHSIASYCSYQKQVQWDENVLRPKDKFPCGVRLMNIYQYIPSLKRHTSIIIFVEKRFAINVTFMFFKVDEHYTAKCEDLAVVITFAYGKLDCDAKPKAGTCGYRHPWSVVVPSNLLVIYAIYVRMMNPIKFHIAYQVVEKCRQLRSHRVAHIVNTQIIAGKYVMVMVMVMLWLCFDGVSCISRPKSYV